MSITTVDGWIAAGKQYLPVSKASLTTVAGAQYSLWLATGQPAAGAAPSTAVVPTSGTQGASLFNNPGGSNLTYAGRVDAFNSVAGTLVLYDRLSHMGGLNGTLTTAQTTTTATITRGDTTGLNVEGFLEWYVATGATATNVSITFTDDTNTSRTASGVTVAANRPASFMLPIPMVSVSAGVRAVQSVTLAASTLTAGNFGVTLCRRLATIPVMANTPVTLDPFTLGLPQVNDSACLFWAFISSTTSSGTLSAAVQLGQA